VFTRRSRIDVPVDGVGSLGKARRDLIAMVPPLFTRAGLIVSFTGVLEILGAGGLLIPKTAAAAAVCLAVLLILIFPANIRAAHENLKIGGRPATPLPLRVLLQFVFISALIVAGFPDALRFTAR
jgi:uncharacterized membrane protein